MAYTSKRRTFESPRWKGINKQQSTIREHTHTRDDAAHRIISSTSLASHHHDGGVGDDDGYLLYI